MCKAINARRVELMYPMMNFMAQLKRLKIASLDEILGKAGLAKEEEVQVDSDLDKQIEKYALDKIKEAQLKHGR